MLTNQLVATVAHQDNCSTVKQTKKQYDQKFLNPRLTNKKNQPELLHARENPANSTADEKILYKFLLNNAKEYISEATRYYPLRE